MLVDIGNVGEIHKRVYLGQFLTNLHADKYAEYKGYKPPIIALFYKFMMAAAFLGIQKEVAAILNKNQLLQYLGQYCILLSTKQHR